MTEKEVLYALTYSQRRSPFYIRSHFVVPHVSWGLGFKHELDLLSISNSGYGVEVEIKVSKSDLKRDLEKKHGHYDPRIRQLYFAGPEELYDAFLEYVPEHAGIITISRGEYGVNPICDIRRNAKINKEAVKFTEKEINQLLRLGNMRYWRLLSSLVKKGKEAISNGTNTIN